MLLVDRMSEEGVREIRSMVKNRHHVESWTFLDSSLTKNIWMVSLQTEGGEVRMQYMCIYFLFCIITIYHQDISRLSIASKVVMKHRPKKTVFPWNPVWSLLNPVDSQTPTLTHSPRLAAPSLEDLQSDSPGR